MSNYVKPFEGEFLKRTRTIILESDNFKYNVTLLLNCTLALVCIPIDRSNEKITINENNDAAKYTALISNLCLKMHELVGGQFRETIINTPEKQKLKCLRNGIAHGKMDVKDGLHEVEGVSITGSTFTAKNKIRWECTFEFTEKALKSFALYMVDEYLKINEMP